MAAFETLWTSPSLYGAYSQPVASASTQGRRGMAAAHPDLSSSAPPRSSSTASVDHVTATTSGSSIQLTSAGNNNGSTITSASALASVGAASSPTDVLLTLPPPILRLLVVSAPFVRFLATASQLVTWTYPNKFACLLVPLGWIAICLGGQVTTKYGLNALLLAMLGVGWMAARGGKKYNSATARPPPSNVRTLAMATASQPAVQVLTPDALNSLLHQAQTLSKHLLVLRRTFSPLLVPFSWQDPSVSWATLNFLLTSYPFYLILTYFVPVRHLVLLAGLAALLWEAPWVAAIRRALWASLLVRRIARVLLRLLQGDLRQAQAEASSGQPGTGLLARLRLARSLPVDSARPLARGRSASPVSGDIRIMSSGKASLAPQSEPHNLEIQYMFTIFENQRWWIGLEWTQALLPNERPSWSDPTHAPCSPPGSFALPSSTTVKVGTQERVFTWKWADPEWRIRGTAGVLISPGTIGANPNPPASTSSVPMLGGQGSSTGGAAKDLKDVMGSLGDWRNMLAHRKNDDEHKDKERRSSTASDSPASPTTGSSHTRKGSASFLSDSLHNLIGAKDGKPVLQHNKEKVNENAGREDIKEKVQQEQSELKRQENMDPANDTDLVGHPRRLDDSNAKDADSAEWVVDSQGWVYADNHWEKPTSKGGMGRYTRRRAWVRKAIVVETAVVNSLIDS